MFKALLPTLSLAHRFNFLSFFKTFLLVFIFFISVLAHSEETTQIQKSDKAPMPLYSDIAVFKTHKSVYFGHDIVLMLNAYAQVRCERKKSFYLDQLLPLKLPKNEMVSQHDVIDYVEKRLTPFGKDQLMKLVSLSKLIEYGREVIWPSQRINSKTVFSETCLKMGDLKKENVFVEDLLRVDQFLQGRFGGEKGQSEFKNFMASLDKKYYHEIYE